MLIPPNPERLAQTKSKISTEFLGEQCDRLGLKGKEKDEYIEFLLNVTARYLELNQANGNRHNKTDQIDNLEKYQGALAKTSKYYREMLADIPTEGKLFMRFYHAFRVLHWQQGRLKHLQ